MEDPKITWYIKRGDGAKFRRDPDFYAGTYNKEEDLEFDIMIWNNRFGEEKVKSLSSFGLTCSFESLEDSVFLRYISFLHNGNVLPSSISNGCLTVPMTDLVLSGAPNDGTTANTGNFVRLRAQLSVPPTYKIKANDIKAIYLDVVEL